ncbi:retrovirus-related Pol polyprotein from transposon 297 [Trichonephila clavipes]|nr:retrovirus-related Pol polyprotein from transposon 297 [Trichonephila clavipes]
MQVKRKTWYDKNAVKREFKDGDLVLVLATSRTNKLAVQWIGPGTILNKILKTNYLVEIPGRRETSQIYHINMLKPYYKRPEHVNVIINDETKNSLADQELEIPYLENNSLVYDFEDVIQASELNKHLHDKQMDRLRELLSKYSKCFSNNPGLTNLVEHEIQLVSDQPVRTKPYRMSHRQNEILKNEINRMLKLGIIEVGESDYMSPMILVERIKRAKLTIKPSKCKFAQQNVKFLGHIVGQGFRTPSEIKVQAVLEFPTPRTKTQIRAFLGLAGYQKYINLFSVIAAPLTDALKGRAKKGEITWTTECENAFRELKGKLIDKPVLYGPNFEREFIVQTDASNAGMGAVLTQLTEQGEEHPILYLSKKFSEVEKRYCTTEKECASIVFAIKRLHYLDGNSFLVMTDHNPLVWLNRNVSSNPRLMRWALALQPYNFRIVHRSGKSHKNADSFSRSIVRVQYFVRGGFVGQRSRASSKHLSPHLPVDELDSLGVKKGLRCRCKMHVWVSGPQRSRLDVDVWRGDVTTSIEDALKRDISLADLYVLQRQIMDKFARLDTVQEQIWELLLEDETLSGEYEDDFFKKAEKYRDKMNQLSAEMEYAVNKSLNKPQSEAEISQEQTPSLRIARENAKKVRRFFGASRGVVLTGSRATGLEEVHRNAETISEGQDSGQSLDRLMTFLRKEVEREEMIILARTRLGSTQRQKVKANADEPSLATSAALVNTKGERSGKPRSCLFCSQSNHWTSHCLIAKKLSLNDKKKKIKEKGIIVPDLRNSVNEIDVLLGADVISVILSGRSIKLKSGLMAIGTMLGFTLMGKSSQEVNDNTEVSVLAIRERQLSMFLNQLNVKELWDLETIGIRDPVENIKSEIQHSDMIERFQKDIKILPSGRYEVALSFKIEGQLRIIEA